MITGREFVVGVLITFGAAVGIGATVGAPALFAYVVLKDPPPGPDCILLKYNASEESKRVTPTRPYMFMLVCPEGYSIGTSWEDTAAKLKDGIVPYSSERVWRP